MGQSILTPTRDAKRNESLVRNKITMQQQVWRDEILGRSLIMMDDRPPVGNFSLHASPRPISRRRGLIFYPRTFRHFPFTMSLPLHLIMEREGCFKKGGKGLEEDFTHFIGNKLI
ncbi:hypothetical protein CDAR_128281 [Caerostris darwini]|uniref:Ycf15 n=1 Tax=Caerostris darwini TaxID=1538125 RepID=A0AAV4RUY3_9ARAC|nr:hypothetical protein CDAR_128241 [Caerostris darwini]GIY24278.1 hypothetical protein CDAR_128281 [Caerostris darwini]